jgi:two-component system invasion response regulator UvrY
MKKIKILIADDHTVVRRGLEQIIAETPDIFVAGEASNGWEVLEKVSNDNYDGVILDIAMPGKDGMDVLTQIKHEKPGLPVLILSMYPEEQFAVRALRAGASGYLTKESAPDELVTAIRKVSAGGKYISSALAEKLAFLLQNTERPLHEALSDREYKVMCLIASGKTVTEIADELSLSIKTISTYRSRVLDKMNLKNNAELTHYAIKNQLVY